MGTHRRFGVMVLGLAVLALMLGGSDQARADYLFWADTGNGDPNSVGIYRSNLDGTDVTQIIKGYPSQVNEPIGVALDSASGHIYWTDYLNNTIERANLDGTGMMIAVQGAAGPGNMAVDGADGKMFWFNTSGLGTNQSNLNSSNLDGTGKQVLLTFLGTPHQLAVDSAVGYLFWADSGNGDPNSVGIYRSNLDGTDVTQIIKGYPSQVNIPYGVAVDSASGQIYWTDYGDGIRRANLDGTGETVLVQNASSPYEMTLDIANGKMYWFNMSGIGNNLTNLNSSNLDGTDEQILLSFVGTPHELAIGGNPVPVPVPVPVPLPSSLALLSLGGVALAAWRRWRKRQPSA